MSILNRIRKKRPVLSAKDARKEPQTSASIAPQPRSKGDELALAIGLLPHRSERALLLEKEGKYVFKVNPHISKAKIKEAVEHLFGVEVIDVKVINLPAKLRRRGRVLGRQRGPRKAIVILRQGERIDLGI